jgi:hypothetical protein
MLIVTGRRDRMDTNWVDTDSSDEVSSEERTGQLK